MSRKPSISLLVAAVLTAALGGSAAATPSDVRLSFMGDGASAVGIAWSTLTGTAEAQVEYGTSPGSYGSTATGQVGTAGGPFGKTSEVTLTKLAPDTTYFYRVGGPKGGWSSESSFRTGPAPDPQCGAVRFVVLGDSRAQTASKAVSDMYPLLLQHILQNVKPAFVLHTGDLVESGGDDAQWATLLKVTAPYSATLPIMYALGNHDDGPGEGDTAYYNRVFLLPRSDKALGGSGTEDYYYFTYANAIFVVLSTQTFKTGTPAFQDQASWLDKVLTQNPRRWKFVALHHPIYTQYMFINHPPNEQGQNAALVPVFNKHHVDMVFQGHNHYYERWAPSACQNPASVNPCPVSYDKGTVFITTGGGGAFPHLLVGGTNNVRLAATAAHHFVRVDIKDNQLALQTVDGTGQVIDTLKITKATGTPDPCVAPPPVDAGPPADGAGPPDSAVAPDSHGPPDGPLSVADVAHTAPDMRVGPPPANHGCSCAVGSGHAADQGWWLLLLALGFALRRRKRPSNSKCRSSLDDRRPGYQYLHTRK